MTEDLRQAMRKAEGNAVWRFQRDPSDGWGHAEYAGRTIECRRAFGAEHWRGGRSIRTTWKIDGKPASRSKVAAL